MLARHAVSDLDWSRVEGLLPARDGKPEWVSVPATVCFSTRFCGWLEPGFPGEICLCGSATGTPSGGVSTAGRRRGSGWRYLRCGQTLMWSA